MNSLKQFYRDYYNENYYRDLRYIKDDTVSKDGIKSKYNPEVLKYPLGSDFNTWDLFLKFLLKNSKRGLGSLVGSITHYNNINEYRSKDQSLLISDRLFFDFDVEDNRTKILKHKIRDVKVNPLITGRERISLIKEYQKDFQKLILEEDLLQEPFKEVMKLKDYLIKLDLNPFIVFSGSKGFHVNLFYRDVNLQDITNLNESLAEVFKKKLDLKLLDFNVYNNILTGVQRVPYNIHERTNLITKPISQNVTYDDFLQEVSRNKREVSSFNIEDYYSSEYFRDLLIKLDSENLSRIEQNYHKQKELQKLQKERVNTSHYKGDKDLIFKDMRELCKLLIGNPSYEREHYNKYSCPFHEDKIPSSLVGRKYFKCYTCNLKLNYFDFIKKFYDLDSDFEVKQKMREIKTNLR